jgi:hypothetical protein
MVNVNQLKGLLSEIGMGDMFSDDQLICALERHRDSVEECGAWLLDDSMSALDVCTNMVEQKQVGSALFARIVLRFQCMLMLFGFFLSSVPRRPRKRS